MPTIPDSLKDTITFNEQQNALVLCEYRIEPIIKLINWTLHDYFCKFYNEREENLFSIKTRAVNPIQFAVIKIDKDKLPRRCEKLLEDFINGMSAEEYEFYTTLFVDNNFQPLILNLRRST